MRTNNPKLLPKGVHFVGIDMSITRPGICRSDSKNEFYCKAFPTPGPKKYRNRIQRFDSIADMVIRQIFETNRDYNSSIILIEDYSFGAKGKTFEIAECIGILKYKLLYEAKIPAKNVLLCSISHLKMFACGKGNVSKDIVIKEVYKRWQFDTNDNNEADAFALWKIIQSLFKPEEKLTTHQKDVLNRIRQYNNI